MLSLTRSQPGRAELLAAATGVLIQCWFPAEVRAGAARDTPITDHRPVCIRGTCFDSEIAVTEAERARGLMERNALAPERGMLFVFPVEGRHTFWMKNTRIPLDMIFIRADNRIVSIVHRAPPCTGDPCPLYAPEGDAAYVLEIAGGQAAAHGFASGDLVEFR